MSALAVTDRLTGLSGLYGKTLRDSRRAFLIEAGLVGLFPMLVLAGIGSAYPSQASRDEISRLATSMGPAAQGLTGAPVNVSTLGGYLQWKYGFVLLLIAALWSVRSLTGSFAGEAGRGSLDVLAATPISRRRLALHKIAAHVTLLSIVSVSLAICTWLGGRMFATLPGDQIPWAGAVGAGVWVEVMSLAFGMFALVISQYLGRSTASWIAGAVLVAGPILNNYRTLVPGVGWLADLTPGAWTADHLPLAGRYDWPSLVLVAAVAVVLGTVAVEAFARRDLGLGNTVRGRTLALPAFGVRGPIGRSLGERLPLAVAWGLGLGVFGLIMGAASQPLADLLGGSPKMAQALARVFPGQNLGTAGGFLQVMIQLLYIVAGFAAVTAVSGYAQDETTGRLEMLLAGPSSRLAWALRSSLGVFLAVAATTGLAALGIGIGTGIVGEGVFTPVVGTLSLGLFAAALAGVGLAVSGWTRASAGAPTMTILVTATYLIDLLVPALHLPEGAHQLALTAHLGQPMIGHWSFGGVLTCLVIAAGGWLLGGLGFSRRDLRE